MVVPVVVGMVRRGELDTLQRTYGVQMRSVVVVTVGKELRTAECAYGHHRSQNNNYQPAHHVRPHEAGEHGQGIGGGASAHGRQSVSGRNRGVHAA